MAHTGWKGALLLATLQIAAAQSSTQAGSPFIRDGAVPSEYFPLWHISYYAVNFLPVCGTYFADSVAYWSNCFECEPAMARFNTSTAKVALYDTAGIETTKGFGSGESFCMCYGVYEESGALLDHCYLVGSAGEIRVRGGYAVGIQAPESNRAKMVPRCKDVSIAENGTVTGLTSVAIRPTNGAGSTRDSNGIVTKPAGTATDLYPGTLSTGSSNESGSSSGSSGGGKSSNNGLSTESIIAIAVGIPTTVIAIGTLAAYLRMKKK